MGTQAVDFGPPPAKSQAVDFGPPPSQSQAVDFGPPPSKARPITDYPVLGPEYAGAANTFAPDNTRTKPAAPLATVGPASALTALNQIPAPVTRADRLLGGESGHPMLDQATNTLFARNRLGKALGYTPQGFLIQQGARAGQQAGQGQYGRGLATLGAAGALAVAGDALGGAANRAGAPVAEAAPQFAQNPTLPEALSPTVNETLAPSAAARAVRSTLGRPGPVRAPTPAEPVDAFMQWSAAAEDPSLSPEVRAQAATRAAETKPAAMAVWNARGATPFPEESNAPLDFGPPPVEGFAFAHEPVVTPERAPEVTGGAEATPNELQEMFSGPGLTAPVRKQLHHVYQSGFVDVNTLLDQPQDQALKGNMQEGGSAQTYGDALARYGVGSARATIPDEKVPLVEAQINADNATARADAREKAGLTEEAANLRAHAANYQSIAGPDIRQDPDFGKYVNRFDEVVTPHLRRLAIQGGLPEERLLSIPNGSPYVPMAADIEKAAPTPTLGPNVPRRPGTKLSSATERATGGAQDYLNDLEEQIRGVAASRQKVAAENQLWQNVKTSGRPVTKDADLEPGEVRVAFTDKNQITTPNSPNATQYVAVPQRVATSVSDYLARNAPPSSGGSMFSRGLRFARSAMTKGAVKIAPIMTKVHGYNILSTVGQVPSESVAGNIAASLPFGSPIAGAAGLYGIDFADPAVASAMIEHARYGGTHPIETGLGSRALFGAQGLDARGRYVLGERRQALHPDESPAQVAQYLSETLGNYNPANQPGFIRGGQSTGLTTFAPAGVAFTRSAVRRTLPIFPGMTPGERLATLGRTLGSAVGTAEALNYANTGHSTFSNEPGHRLDIDRGSKNDQNQENYIRFGALFPMVDRGLRMTGVRPLIEGQGIGGIARAPINEALAQTGIPVRAAGAAFLNMQPRLGPNLMPVLATPPEFNQGKMLANMGARGFLGSLGAASAIAGTNPYDADRSFGQRAADALGLNFGTQGTRGGKTPIPSGYDDKVQTEIFRVYDAKSMADKRAVIQSAVKDAAEAGYPEWMVAKMRIQLLKAAAKSAPHGAP